MELVSGEGETAGVRCCLLWERVRGIGSMLMKKHQGKRSKCCIFDVKVCILRNTVDYSILSQLTTHSIASVEY